MRSQHRNEVPNFRAGPLYLARESGQCAMIFERLHSTTFGLTLSTACSGFKDLHDDLTVHPLLETPNMSFNLSSLLNPAPESPPPALRKDSLPPPLPQSQSPEQSREIPLYKPPTPRSTYLPSATNDAVRALASLAESSAPPPSRKMSSPTSLDAYHVPTRSPEQRRQSIITPEQAAFTLAPIHFEQLGRVSDTNVNMADQGSASADASLPISAPAVISDTSAAVMDPTATVVKQETVAELPSTKVASLKTENSLRTHSPLRESSVPMPTTEGMEGMIQSSIPKKRPAPSGVKKKGTATATKKPSAPASKKRKIETKRSITGTPANSSPAPSTRSYSAEPNETPYAGSDEDEDEGGDDGDVYCVCRKPDNGTFMIGCDGSCDDWFHGKCVGIAESDKNLIDKYICPSCTTTGSHGKTTFKRMCRRSGCRQPARVGRSKTGKESGSKYCSDECGVVFFREMVAGARGREGMKNKANRRRGSVVTSDDNVDVDSSTARGGLLSAGETKALIESAKTAEDFKKLGEGVLSPPATPTSGPGAVSGGSAAFTDAETSSLQNIETRKEDARRRHQLLKDRMKFVTFVKQAATRTTAEKELKPKEYCGFDSRLEWTEDQFAAWRHSEVGKRAFEMDTLAIENSGTALDMEIDDYEPSEVCDRKKCARHLEWTKLAVDDIRFEMSDNSDNMRSLEREDAEIRERAALRTKADGMAGEGSVEVHGLGISLENKVPEGMAV